MIRDSNNLVYFNCKTKTTDYSVRVPFGDFGFENKILVERINNNLVVLTGELDNEVNILKEIKVQDYFFE